MEAWIRVLHLQSKVATHHLRWERNKKGDSSLGAFRESMAWQATSLKSALPANSKKIKFCFKSYSLWSFVLGSSRMLKYKQMPILAVCWNLPHGAVSEDLSLFSVLSRLMSSLGTVGELCCLSHEGCPSLSGWEGGMMHFVVDFSGIKEARQEAACMLILARSMEMELGSGKHPF